MSEWVSENRSVMSDSLRPRGLYSPWNSPGQNTGVGSLSLLQEIFPAQGSNPGLLHCRWILYQLSHKGSLRILEWVAYPFSSRSSQPRNLTRVSCIAGRFFTNWAMREAQWFNNIMESGGVKLYKHSNAWQPLSCFWKVLNTFINERALDHRGHLLRWPHRWPRTW